MIGDRRIPRLSAGMAWESQAGQYDRPDIAPNRFGGITWWTVPADLVPVRVECLLHWTVVDRAPLLTGILNYYPDGAPAGERPGDALVLVRPGFLRRGIGTALVRAALDRWPDLDLAGQSFTPDGLALAASIADRGWGTYPMRCAAPGAASPAAALTRVYDEQQPGERPGPPRAPGGPA